MAELLRGVLASCHVRSLHYGFGPSPTPENLRLQGEASDLRNTELGLAFQSALESAQDEHGMLYAEYWPVDSPVGDVVEAQVGLLGAVRQGASFREASPSLVVGLLVRSGERLDDLTPAQLEELVSALLQCEGWTVEHTPATRDGGKDLIARRDDDNRAMVYVEVKHLKKSKVNVGQVREFVAVMGGDGIDRGYLVTSSAFTRDALAWARERGKRIAVLEPIDGESLRQRLEAAASGIRSVIPKIPASATTRRERTVAQTRASKPAEYTGSSPPAEDR